MIDELAVDDSNRPYWAGSFKVGDRVRVRQSGECRARFYPRSYLTDERRPYVVGHSDNENGATATIERIQDDGESQHNFVVVFDLPVLDPPRRVFAKSYAATELEPLESQ